MFWSLVVSKDGKFKKCSFILIMIIKFISIDIVALIKLHHGLDGKKKWRYRVRAILANTPPLFVKFNLNIFGIIWLLSGRQAVQSSHMLTCMIFLTKSSQTAPNASCTHYIGNLNNLIGASQTGRKILMIMKCWVLQDIIGPLQQDKIVRIPELFWFWGVFFFLFYLIINAVPPGKQTPSNSLVLK